MRRRHAFGSLAAGVVALTATLMVAVPPVSMGQSLPPIGGGYTNVTAIPVNDAATKAIAGALFKPAGAGPFPAVIYISGCRGLNGSPPPEMMLERTVIDHLLAKGVATLIVDPFTPRNEPEGMCASVVNLNEKTDIQINYFIRGGNDALAAVKVLRAMPEIDPKRIFLLGYSYGAISSLFATDAKKSGADEVAGVIAFYPYCYENIIPSRPTLVLHGDKDDWTPANLCQKLQGKPNVDLVVYPGVFHAFASPRGEPIDFLGHHIVFDVKAALDAQQRADALIAALMRLSDAHTEAIALLERMAQRLNIPSTNKYKGKALNINLRIAVNLLQLGEVSKAEVYVNRNAALLLQARTWVNAQPYLSQWEGLVEQGRASLASGRGRFSEAATAFNKAEALYRDSFAKSRSWPMKFPPSLWEHVIDSMAFDGGIAKMRQGQYAEAEIDVRRALLSRLKAVGKYHIDTADMLNGFSSLLMEQSRVKDADALARASMEILGAIGYCHDTNAYVSALLMRSHALFLQRRYDEAKESFAAIDAATRFWSPDRRVRYRTSGPRIFLYYRTGEVDEGIALARQMYERDKATIGEQHYGTALARATVAAGLAIAGRDAEATLDYAASLPVLLSAANEPDDEDATVALLADRRLELVLEPYIALLARSNSPNRAEEGLRVVEALRSRSVRNALSDSAARAAARTPALADLVRTDQDLRKQVLAQAGLLDNVLSEPPPQRQESTINDLRQGLEKLRKERQGARHEIQRRFPEYDRLINPGALVVDDIRAALKPDEALLSFYFGLQQSFVWAMPKEGPIIFSQIPLTATQFEVKVEGLAQGARLERRFDNWRNSPFDVAAAHELYELLLEPVEQGWRPARSLIVVTNGALGMLPLGLLPTESAEIENKVAGEPYFASYCRLARTHATVSLPSVGALLTLRGSPAPSSKREPLIGFGDPFFNVEQAREAAIALPAEIATGGTRGSTAIKLHASIHTRGLRSATLSMLPRLPETADELRSIAAALHVDPNRALHLGKDANEKTIRDLDLSRFRIVAFATHSLALGDLDGLTQPALALTAPEVAGVDGDGVLGVDKILGLKLNADWVVLSACNTGAGAGADAEAVSGLGRAFFYAGSRALLVTNWPVESLSAREIVSGVFWRQADNPKLTRMEALRQAMVALMEGGVAKDEAGKPLYTYAHSTFWVPYTIVGDGG